MAPETLFNEHQKLVYFAICRYFPTHKGDEDVEATGFMGLWKACTKYDPAKGAFSTYAMHYICGYIRKSLHSVSVFSTPTDAVELRQLLNSKTHTEPGYANVETALFFEQFFKTLKPADQQLCTYLCQTSNKSEAARHFNVSRPAIDKRIERIHRQYINFTRKRSRVYAIRTPERDYPSLRRP